MTLEFISIRDTNGRVSSLEISNNEQIQVVGVLEHCSLIQPDTIEGATKLRDWLNNYISAREHNHDQ